MRKDATQEGLNWNVGEELERQLPNMKWLVTEHCRLDDGVSAVETRVRLITGAMGERDGGKGNVAGATVNWVTQTAFNPPLVVAGVKTDSGAYSIIKNTKTFTLNMLGKEHKGLAFTFFKPAQMADGKLSGQAIHKGTNGAPILDAALAAVECKVTSIVEQGDHHIVVGEVTEAHLPKAIDGRPDGAILEMKDLGDIVYDGA